MPFNLFSGDPQSQAMLALSAGLLESGGPSRTPVGLGQGAARGMMAGREAFMQAQEAQMKQKLFDLKMAEAQKAQEQEAAKREWLMKAMQGGQPSPQMGVSPSSASAMNAPWASAANFPQSPAGPQPLSPQMLMQGLSVGAPVKDVLAIQDAQNPNFKFTDMGGYTLVSDKMGREVKRIPKTAAPGAIPSHLADLDASGQRDFLLNKAERGAPKTMIDVSGDAFARAAGTKSIERLGGQYDAADAAVSSLPNLYALKNHIQNSNALTGPGAELMLQAERFKQFVTGSQKAGKTVSDTQILDAMLGADVFPMIKALGIGARGLDTPAEREFLRKVMTGVIPMDKEALVKMADIRINIQERAIKKVNEKIDTGDYDEYFKYSRIPKRKFDLPSMDGSWKIEKVQ